MADAVEPKRSFILNALYNLPLYNCALYAVGITAGVAMAVMVAPLICKASATTIVYNMLIAPTGLGLVQCLDLTYMGVIGGYVAMCATDVIVETGSEFFAR